MIRCKFKVDSITKVACNPEGVSVDMTAVKCEPFGEHTPCGSIKMHIAHAEAGEQIQLGKEYFVDFTPVE